MKIHILPQVTKQISCNLPEEVIMQVLEKKFETGKPPNTFLDKLSPAAYSRFERGNKLFRIDKAISIGRNGTLDLVALGYLKEQSSGQTITLVYALYNDAVSMMLWFWLVLIAAIWLVFLSQMLYQRTIAENLFVLGFLFLPSVPALLFREYLKSEIAAVHSKIVWTLKKLA